MKDIYIVLYYYSYSQGNICATVVVIMKGLILIGVHNINFD